MYTFKCKNCETIFDSIEKFDDVVLLRYPDCPKCNKSESVEKQITIPGNYYINGDNSASVRPKGGFRK